MNPTAIKVLTFVGTQVVKTIIEKTAEKLSESNGLSKQENEKDLTVGYKVKGNPNIFFDFTAIKTYIKKDKPLTEKDIAMVVVNANDPRIKRSRFMRVKPEDILGTYKFEPKMIVAEVWSALTEQSKKDEEQEQVRPEIESPKQEVKSEVKKQEDIIEDNVENTDEDFNLKEKPYVAKLNVSKDGSSEEIVEIEEDKSALVDEPENTTFLGKMAKKSVTAVAEVTHNISELAETVDQMKGKISIKIIHEVCDTNTSLEAFEGEIKGTHRVVKGNQGTIEILHIYQNGRYAGSYHKADLFAVLAPMIAEKRIEITKIKHIKTIRGEFQPKEKF